MKGGYLSSTDIKATIRNYLILIIGLFIMAFGVAISVKSGLGTTPISCIPNVLTMQYPLSLGTITIIFNLLLIFVQVLILRSNFEIKQFLQIFVNVIFGYFIDFALDVTSFMVPTTIVEQWQLCILSCFVIAFGVFLEVNSKAILLPGEGVSIAIKKVTNIEFGKIKTCFDSTNVIVGVILSLYFFGQLRGVGLGTVFAGIVVGYIVRFYRKIILYILNSI